MIKRQKERYNWEFIFLGANIDAIQTAERFGIDKDCASNYVADCRGTELNYQAMNMAISIAVPKEKLIKCGRRKWKVISRIRDKLLYQGIIWGLLDTFC